MKQNPDGTITVRIKASGQVIDMMPSAAIPMVNGGLAEQFTRVRDAGVHESAAVDPTGERKILSPPAKKAFLNRGNRR